MESLFINAEGNLDLLCLPEKTTSRMEVEFQMKLEEIYMNYA